MLLIALKASRYIVSVGVRNKLIFEAELQLQFCQTVRVGGNVDICRRHSRFFLTSGTPKPYFLQPEPKRLHPLRCFPTINAFLSQNSVFVYKTFYPQPPHCHRPLVLRHSSRTRPM